MTDANEYGVVREGTNLVLNNTPPDVETDYVTDNEDKMARELMPDRESAPASNANGATRANASSNQSDQAQDRLTSNGSAGQTNVQWDRHNETSNTVAGINTPPSKAGQAASDPLNEFVEQTMNNVQQTVDGKSQ